MNWNTVIARLAAIGLVISAGCSSTTGSPTVTVSPAPKITAPAAQSPANGQVVAGLTVTLSAGSATVDLSTYVLQYRFQVFDKSGTLVQDSGLVSASTWPIPVALTPNSAFTWKVRAESQGFAGPWSDAAGFTTPDQPPAYTGMIGDWQSCASQASKAGLVACVWNAIKPVNSVGDMEVVKRVAWLLRGEGAGLLIKSGGDNVIIWQGYSLSASRLCYPDGHIYKLIGDAGPGGSNAPQFADNGFVDKSMYVPAIDPSKP